MFDPREFESPLDPKDLMAMFRSLSFNRCFMRLHMKKARLDRDSAIAAAEVFQHNSEIRVLCVTECAPHTSLMMAVMLDSAVLPCALGQSLTLRLPIATGCGHEFEFVNCPVSAHAEQQWPG